MKLNTTLLRKEFLQRNNRCLNCGDSNHRIQDCKSKGCRNCNKPHHTSICFRSTNQGAKETPLTHGKSGRKTTTHTCVSHDTKVKEDGSLHQKPYTHRRDERVLLLVGTNVDILLDTGSELSFIDAKLSKSLNLPILEEKSLLIHKFGSEHPERQECNVITIDIFDQDGQQHSLHLHTSDILTTTLQRAKLSSEDLQFIRRNDIDLALPKKQNEIQPQILLGCDQLWTLLSTDGTQLGYIVSGLQRETTAIAHRVNTIVSPYLDNGYRETWERFWTMDSSGINEFHGQDIQQFRETIQLREDGYYVRLPWKEHQPPLPDNRAIAMKRLDSVLKSLKNNSWTMNEYDKTFKEQLKQGILEEVDENDPIDGILHYIPHQAVITPQKDTTKLRVVFDASAHYKGCPSLNEVIHQGPLIMPELYGMLLRFRIPSYVIIADVEKAFLQVRLQEADRDATRCLWIKDISKPPKGSNIVVYRFTRVTFGINASPFLLAFHLENGKDKHTKLTEEIQHNLYVDNLLLGAETIDERTKNLFNKLNMNLREFMSNNKDFVKHIQSVDLANNQVPKVLGIPWDSGKDEILLRCLLPEKESVTKRTVSQQLASIYDPIGFLVPLLLKAKVFLQSLWATDYAWDSPLQNSHRTRWLEIHPARIIVFTDASQQAIATCAYLSTTDDSYLIMAKSKLASLKGISTIPKLEMNAITIGTRLALAVFKSLRSTIPIHEIFILSDSEIALKWIQAPLDRKCLGVLVSNRCREIRKIVMEIMNNGTHIQFGHVPTHLNPADCATRGLSAHEFDTHYWWNGPEHIRRESSEWPTTMSLFRITWEDDNIVTATTTNHISHSNNETNSLLNWSIVHMTTRVMAQVLRFIKRCMSTSTTLQGYELKQAHEVLIRDFQQVTITDGVLRQCPQLNLQKDKAGIFRCYGRLDQSHLNDEEKSPIFITPKTPFSFLIIRDKHAEYHKGTAHTMAAVREQYWIPYEVY
uniref:DUF1758 domain-containing protein n=1 Tax=Heterorhabditis bacteriophora TaxID=37862 RepID=A0A1I7W6R0_HETBA